MVSVDGGASRGVERRRARALRERRTGWKQPSLSQLERAVIVAAGEERAGEILLQEAGTVAHPIDVLHRHRRRRRQPLWPEVLQQAQQLGTPSGLHTRARAHQRLTCCAGAGLAGARAEAVAAAARRRRAAARMPRPRLVCCVPKAPILVGRLESICGVKVLVGLKIARAGERLAEVLGLARRRTLLLPLRQAAPLHILGTVVPKAHILPELLLRELAPLSPKVAAPAHAFCRLTLVHVGGKRARGRGDQRRARQAQAAAQDLWSASEQ
jgi:hypothetical protein